MEEQKKPWTIQRPLHLSLNSAQQKYALVPAGKEESCRVASYYEVCPAPGYEINRIDIVFNPRMIQEFELYLSRLQEKENNLAFMPDWQREDEKAGKSTDDIAWRAEIDASLKALAAPYTVSAYPSVQILPLWHGTERACLDSIFRVGYANLSTTDEGYFGRGIYGTPEPRYAKEVYSAGSLLLNWVGFFAAYPVMDGDMSKLRGKANYKQYDAHFVPVVPASNDPDEKKILSYQT